MRPITIAVTLLAGIATILGYLGLAPPQILKYFPHISWSQENSPAPTLAPTSGGPPSAQASFSGKYADGFARARHGDFSMAVEYYKAAVAAPDASPAELAKAYDAMGYAYYRMGDFDDADSALASALQNDPSGTEPRVNQIKVMCGRRTYPVSVSVALGALRVRVAGNGFATREVEGDRELFQKCAYAGITPR